MGVPRVIWKQNRERNRRDHTGRRGKDAVTRRARGVERLEPRRLLAADPIHVGVVYLETDYLETDQDVGSDSQGDRFILSFTGGAADTELSELKIRTDKDGDGITVGDPIYDTAAGGRGKNGSHGFQLVKVNSSSGQTIDAVAEVEDGGQELVLRLTNFRAGDRIEFTLDVDEVLRNAVDLALFNDRLDVITSGQEFQDSILEASFEAPHYETSHADAVFLNDYGDPAANLGLNLPPDEGTDLDSRPNRSAAAVGSSTQVPKPVEISGNVWLDNDLDALREPGESPLAGVEISLWKSNDDGTFADTGFRSTSDSGGRYLFPKSLGLLPGNYRLVETQPADLFSVGAVAGTINGQTVGTADTPDVLTGIELPVGDSAAINYDFAEAEPASLSGYVYQDDDNDGQRDSGEAGIAGVRVQLIPVNTIAPQSALTVTSRGDGSYSFSGLAPGSYEAIEVDQPVHLDDGIDTAGTIHGVIVGVANNPGDQITGITLSGADSGQEYNFGEVPFGSLSGFVFVAAPGSDCEGQHDAEGNTPLPGVQLAIQNDQGVTVARTTTGADGGYTFDNLPLGNYRIIEFTPSEWIDGGSTAGRIGNLKVGTAVDGGLIQDITLTAGGIGVEYNFCELAPASISGYVYHDRSNDGVRDQDEGAIEDVRILLIDADGQLVATEFTDAEGRYEFAGVTPGQYTVFQQQPLDFVDGIDTIGTVDNQPSGSIEANDTISSIVLKQGQQGLNYNFGELLSASLFGRVHVDNDGDCVFSDGEETLAGVTIRLIDDGGQEVGNTLTNQQGQYSFENLHPGRYTVIEEQPDGYFDGNAKVGTAGGVSDGGNRILDITLTSGETALDYDFCERAPGEISGRVFNDGNEDCFFQADEQGIEGVRVELFDGDNQLVASTSTDSLGNYRFTGLPEGNFTVRETQPAGWLQGGQRAGNGNGDDTVPDVISQIRLNWGQRLTQYNFCELEGASISGIVFVDGNGDCLQQADELPLEGVRIELRDDSGKVVDSTTSDASGQYRFSDLLPDTYQIFELQPQGLFHGGQRPGSGGGEVLADDLIRLSLATGAELVDYNFCELAPAKIRGVVHVDNDGDCSVDDDDPPIEGAVIELRDADGKLIAQTTTDADGRYFFEGLRPAAYQIFEYQPDGFFQGSQRSGSGDGEVLGEDLLGVRLSSGELVVDYNFCELAPSSISGSVWSESDPDQRFDRGDTPIPGVVIELIDTAGDVIERRQTDTAGFYRFESLAPGIYQVREMQPSGFFHGGQVVGDMGGQVGGDDLLIGITLQGGTDAMDYNFPEVPPATISGYVFQDGDAIVLQQSPDPTTLREFRDGQRTVDDSRIEGVTLELRNVLGLPFDASRALSGVYPEGPIRATTDEAGYYQFTGLRPGTYHVYQVQPDDYIDGLDTPGTTGGVAVNPADTPADGDRIMIQTLAFSEATDPRDDAILNITLVGGGESVENNFSEIVLEQPQQPPVYTLPKLDRADAPVPLVAADSQIRTIAYVAPRTSRSIVFDQDEWAVSWHLSVINGGYPRGTLDDNGIVRNASSIQTEENWTSDQHASGKWSISSRLDRFDDIGCDFTLGDEDAIALTGDFDGDGKDEPAIYIGGQWFVDLNGNGRWDAGDLWVRLGTALDRPVVGDWDGDGKDDVGIFGRQWLRDPQRIQRDPGLPDPDNKRRRLVDSRQYAAMVDAVRGEDRPRLLRRGNDGSLRADAVDHVFQYGDQVDTPISGDWNGDGIDQIAVFRRGQWLLDDDGDGRWTRSDRRATFGQPGDEPIVGDFNGDEIDEIGIVRGDLWIIDTDGDRRITGNDLQIEVPRDSEASQPIVGDFDGDGKDEPGYYDDAA